MKALAFLFLSLPLAAQVIEGDVVNAATGGPVANARASIPSPAGRTFAQSDAQGHFRIELPDQMYVPLMVVYPGLLTYQTMAGSRPGIATEPRLRIELTPEGVVTGKVEDADGFPARQADVQALHYQIVDGQRVLQPASSVMTNDFGEFRVAGLAAGWYYLCTSPGSAANWDPRYGKTCPTDAIEVAVGQETAAPVIRLARGELTSERKDPQPLPATLNGKVVTDDGSTPGAVTLSLGQRSSASVTTTADGAFRFDGLAPGHYDVVVTSTPRGWIPVSARLGDREVLRRGFDWNGTPAGPLEIVLSARRILVSGELVNAAGHAVPNAVVALVGAGARQLWSTDAQGRFSSAWILPGDYRVYVLRDDRQFPALDDPAYLNAHAADLPPVHVAATRTRTAPLHLSLPN